VIQDHSIPSEHRRAIPADEPHEPWKARAVMWGTREGLHHVVSSAAVVGEGVVQVIACGGATTFHGLRISTFYGMRHDRRARLCRRCLKVLAGAGESGRVR
jgi:hypothetical protein